MSRDFKVLKYNKAKLAVMRLIAENGMASGDKLPPERELAQKLPYSIITLRHALAVLEKDGVISRNRRTGTFLKKQLKDIHFETEVLVVSVAKRGEDVPYSPRLEPLRLYLEKHGIGLRIKTVYEFGTDILEAAEHTIGIFVSGWLTDNFLERLQVTGLPILVVGNNKLNTNLPMVGYDMEMAAFCQTERLLREGKQKILLIGVSKSYHSSQLYRRGYCKALKKIGLPPVISSTDSILESTKELEDFLAEHNDADAILLEAAAIYNYMSWYWRENRSVRPDIAFLTKPDGLHQYRQSKHFRFIQFDDLYLTAAEKLLDNLFYEKKIESAMLLPTIPEDNKDEMFFLF